MAISAFEIEPTSSVRSKDDPVKMKSALFDAGTQGSDDFRNAIDFVKVANCD